MKVAFFVLASLAVVLATPVKRQVNYSQFAYQLPAGAELLVSGLKTAFTCATRKYGYYADVDNNCNVFHVCLPILDEALKVLDVAQYSFVCGNRTTFDQQNLVCVHPEDADCGNAAKLYDSSNAEFGVIPNKG